MGKFKLNSSYKPGGDQPQAIERLVQGLNANEKYQILMGGTGFCGDGFARQYWQRRRMVFSWWHLAIISALLAVVSCAGVVFAGEVDKEAERTGRVIIVGDDYDHRPYEFLNENVIPAGCTAEFTQAVYGRCLAALAPVGVSFGRIFKYAAVVLVPLLVFLASSFVFSKMLKRQVVTKTMKLEQEIADRKRAEAALRLSEQCFRAIADYTYFWEIWVGPDGRPLWTNPAVQRVTGYTIKELMQMEDYPMPLIYEQDKGKIARAFKSALNGSTGKSLEFRIRRKDETVIWASMSWQPIYDEKGTSQGHRASVRDITDRKHAEQALAHERDLLHILMENMPDTIFFKDTASRFTRINTAQANLLGVSSPEEAVGKTDFDFFPRELAERYYADEQAMLQSGKPLINREEPTTDSNGNKIWVSTTKVPLRDKKGNIVGLVGISRDITKHKYSEDALKLTQFALDNSADASFWMGPDAQFVYVNNAACRLLGYSREELLTMTVHDIDPDFPREIWPKHWEEVRQRGSFTLESHHRTKDGKVFPIEISVNYINFGGKEYNCAFARDTTERKEAEKILQKSEERYRALVENIELGITLIDANHNIVMTNSAVSKLFGRPTSEFIGKKCYNRFEKRGTVCPHCPGIKAMETGQAEEIETEGVRESGNRFPIRIQAFPLFSDDKEATGFIEVVEDITSRKQAEEKLRESEEQYRAIFEQAADSIVLIDAETGVMVRFNDKAHESLGYTRDEFKKLKIPEFEVIESAEEVTEHINKIVSDGGDTFETKHKTKSGEIRNILVSARGISIGGKDFIQAIWRDITEYKQAEAARERLTRELEEKNKELESILYVASHDLKSPLVNIQGFSNELSRSCDLIRLALETKERTADVEKRFRFALDESVPEALGFISSSASKMDSLLSGLLRLCRLGSAAMEPELLDMNTLLARVARSMEYQIKKVDVKLEIEQLPPCIGDISQVNQVFSNLLDNALKYLDDSRPGVIRIYGRTEQKQSIYCVEDNGIGIAPDHQDKIFEIFHQLEPDEKTGEGLGLTIVRRIIDRHNGKIWVESESGKGSKFFVSLPGT